ncbi:gliding motility-associated ABC transporter substrate-binding protein GldG [Puteibacter caeruleilacunae]|nr:gliding motility-associated ABC transporter substrate-binding protein GldG [Puteibacter caeruleilacunae]
MFSLIKKEINSFLSTIAGYLVVVLFLAITGLFLWVFPGNFNIIEGGYASLIGLFQIAPWVYLLLIPAVTMRLFAEEKKSGTLELLMTRPLSAVEVVGAKYLAALFIVLLSLVPTLVYYYSVYQLGDIPGNIDTGATWGAYIGLFFLSAIYVAIGLFTSSITNNQIVAFLLAVTLSFLMYIGFDFIGQLSFNPDLQAMFVGLGINEHYLSISRGVIDTRDIIYFCSVIGMFLMSTVFVIRTSPVAVKRMKSLGIIVLALIGINWISSKAFHRLDLTAENRYTLSETTCDILNNQKEAVWIEVYLSDDIPANLRGFQRAIVEKVQDLKAVSQRPVRYRIIDPYAEVDLKDRKQYFQYLMKRGLQPIDVKHRTDQGEQTRRLFPGVILRNENHEVALNLLRDNPMLNYEQDINNAIEALEYEFARGLSVLSQDNKPHVAFVTGHGELDEWETADLTLHLKERFRISRVSIDSLKGSNDIALAIIAGPKEAFSERDKLILDQYIMSGKSTLWLIDAVNVITSELESNGQTVGFPADVNLKDQLFRYGVRLNADLVQDQECLLIKAIVDLPNGKSREVPAPWHYSPLISLSQNHVITMDINRVKGEFVSSIDFVGEDEQVKKSVLLTSSRYGRKINAPVEIQLSSISAPPAKELFNQQSIPLGVLLEGQFQSVFKNRLFDANVIDGELQSKSDDHTKMVVLGDANIIANKVRRVPGKKTDFLPLGYDRFSRQTFGNKEFLSNVVSYLCDESGIMNLRSRVFKLRLLDKVSLKENKTKWQLINVLLPVLLFVFIGIIFNVMRWKSYSQ